MSESNGAACSVPEGIRDPEELVIVGSGPAGWTAALYAARANLNPLVFAGRPSDLMMPGGQLMYTTEVENYPGYPKGTQGPEMMKDLRDQALRFGVRVMTDKGPQSQVQSVGGYDNLMHWQDVASVEFVPGGTHTLTSDKGERVRARCVIVATGARANYLGLESEKKFMNGGVSACAVCDGALPRFRDKPVAVVGGGDSAMEEAGYLAKFASTVHLIVRRDELRASKIMQDRVLGDRKVTVHWRQQVAEVLGTEAAGVTGVKLESTADGSHGELEVAGLFLAIGHTPNVDFLGNALELKDNGYVRWTRPHRTDTSVEGVFAAGDVADDHYKQAITAAGSGCMAALDAEKYLTGKMQTWQTEEAAAAG